MSRCRACKAEITWVETKNGKKMPLDAASFNAVQVREGIGEIVKVFMPHWATCPGADRFRGKT